jgi:cathepsin C
MAGGKKSRYSYKYYLINYYWKYYSDFKFLRKPKSAEITPEVALIADSLPDSFDWRNISGISYVSPIRNQGSCGSCYTFGSMAMHESRLRIKTLNQQKNIFSTQDIVSCSNYSQGYYS